MNIVANGKGQTKRQTNWGYHHTVLHIRSRLHNIAWFIDLTGAQYGNHQLLYQSDEYKTIFVQDIERYYRFGFLNAMFKKLAKIGGRLFWSTDYASKLRIDSKKHLSNGRRNT